MRTDVIKTTRRKHDGIFFLNICCEIGAQYDPGCDVKGFKGYLSFHIINKTLNAPPRPPDSLQLCRLIDAKLAETFQL